jgi:hypothetical protein
VKAETSFECSKRLNVIEVLKILQKNHATVEGIDGLSA